jgi:hypothetical protein
VTFTSVSVYRIDRHGTFNTTTWSGAGGTAYSLSAVAGVLSSTQPGGRIY